MRGSIPVLAGLFVLAVVAVVPLLKGMIMRAVDFGDAAVKILVGFPDHLPGDEHSHIAQYNGDGIRVADLRQVAGPSDAAGRGEGKNRQGGKQNFDGNGHR